MCAEKTNTRQTSRRSGQSKAAIGISRSFSAHSMYSEGVESKVFTEAKAKESLYMVVTMIFQKLERSAAFCGFVTDRDTDSPGCREVVISGCYNYTYTAYFLSTSFMQSVYTTQYRSVRVSDHPTTRCLGALLRSGTR